MTFEPSAKWRNYAKIVYSLDGSSVKKGAVTCERRAAEDKTATIQRAYFNRVTNGMSSKPEIHGWRKITKRWQS